MNLLLVLKHELKIFVLLYMHMDFTPQPKVFYVETENRNTRKCSYYIKVFRSKVPLSDFLQTQTSAGAKDPPLSVVRKFVHLLEQSSLDLQEEQEMTWLREEVVTKIRSNQQMEKDLNLMDIKIGLLVKNRITLQVGNIKEKHI